MFAVLVQYGHNDQTSFVPVPVIMYHHIGIHGPLSLCGVHQRVLCGQRDVAVAGHCTADHERHCLYLYGHRAVQWMGYHVLGDFQQKEGDIQEVGGIHADPIVVIRVHCGDHSGYAPIHGVPIQNGHRYPDRIAVHPLWTDGDVVE